MSTNPSSPTPDPLPPSHAQPSPGPDMSSPTGPQEQRLPIQTTSPEHSSRVQEQRPHWATPILRGWIVLVGVIAWMVKQAFDNWQSTEDLPSLRNILLGAAVVLGVALVQAVIGFLQWRTTTFRIDDEEVRVDRRFIIHSSDRIARSKIQSVDVIQPFAARLVGLARLRIDIGGSSAHTIEYLTRADAYRFRDFFTSTADGVGTPVAPGSVWADRRTDESVITAVSPRQVVLGTFISGNFMWTVVLAAAGIVVPMVLDAQVVSIPLVVGAVVAAVRVVTGTLMKYWHFTLLQSARGLKVVHGMTTLTTRSVPVHRVQGIAVSQPLLWRLTGLHKVEVTVLGGLAEADVLEAKVLLPMGTADQVARAVAALWPGFQMDSVDLHPIPRRARWLRWFDRQTFWWGLDDRVIVARHGLFTRVRAVVPHSRVQSTRLHQGPLQRRLRLADLSIQIPAGPVQLSCRHLDAGDTRELLLTEMDRCRAARRAETAALSGSADDPRETPTPPLQ